MMNLNESAKESDVGLDNSAPLLRQLLNGRLLAVLASAVVFVAAGGCMEHCEKCRDTVRQSVKTCLYRNVPAFPSRVCDPSEIDGLLKELSEKCPGGVGDMDEGIPVHCDTREISPFSTTVRETATVVLNEECKDVMTRRPPQAAGGGGVVIIPIMQ